MFWLPDNLVLTCLLCWWCCAWGVGSGMCLWCPHLGHVLALAQQRVPNLRLLDLSCPGGHLWFMFALNQTMSKPGETWADLGGGDIALGAEDALLSMVVLGGQLQSLRWLLNFSGRDLERAGWNSLGRRNYVPEKGKFLLKKERKPKGFPSLGAHSCALPHIEEQKERFHQCPPH